MRHKPAILVTGGAGFIGSHACKALAQAGFIPVAYDNLSTGFADAVRWGPAVFADVRDRATLAHAMNTHDIEAVLHFAASASVAESMVNPAKYHDNNVGGMIALLSVMQAKPGPGRIVLSSSCATYGLAGGAPITEETRQEPVNPYGRSKLICEQILGDYAAAYGMHPAILRYFNAAGADPDGQLKERHNPETHIIPLALMAAAGQRQALDIFGTDYDTRDGTCVRDYIHVTDLARAHVLALRRLFDGCTGLTVNLGSGTGISVLDVVHAVERVTGHRVPVQLMARRAGDPPSLIADPRLASTVLGFRTEMSDIDTLVADAAFPFGPEARNATAP